MNDPARRFPPLGIRDILDETFILWRRHFGSFFLAMVVVGVPSEPTGAIESSLPLSDGKPPPEAASLLALRLALVAIDTAIFSMGEATVVLLTSWAVVGATLEVRPAYRDVLGHWIRVVIASLPHLAILLVSAIPPVMAVRSAWWIIAACIVVPLATYVLVGWPVVLQVILLEGRGLVAGLGRSWGLVRGQRRRALAVFTSVMAISLIGVLPNWLAESLAGSLTEHESATSATSILGWTVASIVRLVVNSLFGALPAIAATLLYFDLRARNDTDGLNLDDVARATKRRSD